MKKSVHQIWRECKNQNLTNKDFIARLKQEGIIIPKKKKLTNHQEFQIIQSINKVSKFHFFTTKTKPIKNRKLRKHFGFDDLKFAEFVMEIEKSFNITLPDDKLNHVKTLNDFLKLVEKQL